MKVIQEVEGSSDERLQVFSLPDRRWRKMLTQHLLKHLADDGIEESEFVGKVGIK